MLSYCGLRCDTCPIRLATLEEDPGRKREMREEIAVEYSGAYGVMKSADDISDCDGCRAESGRLFGDCASCKIRKCAAEKDINNCAYCENYGCKALSLHFMLDPESKGRLEHIRKGN